MFVSIAVNCFTSDARCRSSRACCRSDWEFRRVTWAEIVLLFIWSIPDVVSSHPSVIRPMISPSRRSTAGVGQIVRHPGFSFEMMTVLTLTTGTAFIMWLGEQISERGIGNGMSLIIFAGIVVGLPTGIFEVWRKVAIDHEWSPLAVILLVVLFVRPQGLFGGSDREKV